MKKLFAAGVILSLVFCFTVYAHANLEIIGQAQYGGQNYNLIWDKDSPVGSIVWLDYTSRGINWDNAVTWASGLNGAGVVSYAINPSYSISWGGDWRLPSTVDGPLSFGHNGDGTYTYGYAITSSEMGHLFYAELGNLGFVAIDGTQPQPGYGLANTGLFTNLFPTDYWSGTQYTADTTYTFAWEFDYGNGLQWVLLKTYDLNAMAVRPVSVNVSEPGMLLLLGSGLMGLLAGRKMFKR